MDQLIHGAGTNATLKIPCADANKEFPEYGYSVDWRQLGPTGIS